MPVNIIEKYTRHAYRKLDKYKFVWVVETLWACISRAAQTCFIYDMVDFKALQDVRMLPNMVQLMVYFVAQEDSGGCMKSLTS